MIFYFTATGNSFFAVEQLRSENETIVSIAKSYRDAHYTFDAKHDHNIGFVLPVYFFGIPYIVAKFIHRIELLLPPNPYVYLVLTCGSTTGQAGRLFKHAIAGKGIALNAQFAVKMPNNYIPSFNVPNVEKQQRMLNRAAASLTLIHQEIHHHVNGDQNHCKGPLPLLLTKFFYPRYEKIRKTKKFRVSDACNGCGICAQICPDKAIAIQEKHPVWVKAQCSLCLACVHRCPKHAIDFGTSTRNKTRYVNTALSREKYALVDK